MSLLSDFDIPIGILVAGYGLAAQAFERRTANNFGQAWQAIEFTVIYCALYGRYLPRHTGIGCLLESVW